MIYFFHHYELPAIRQQAQLQQMFMRSARSNNNNRRADNGQAGQAPSGNQQMNRENQQPPTEAPTAQARPANNANNMFVMRGTRYVNQLFHFLNLLADNNNNNANDLQNQPGRLLTQNLTRSLRMLFPNRPILNVRIINVRSASASATVADIMRHNAEGIQSQQSQNSSEETVERISSQVNPNENSQEPLPSPTISDGETAPPDLSSGNDANGDATSSTRHQEPSDADANNRLNVMQSSESGEGSQTTSMHNEQC